MLVERYTASLLGAVGAMAESLDLYINVRRHFGVQRVALPEGHAMPGALISRIERAFSQGQGAGLVHLAATEVTTALPPGLAFARVCPALRDPAVSSRRCRARCARRPVALPGEAELEALRLAAPLIRGWCAPRAFRPTTA